MIASLGICASLGRAAAIARFTERAPWLAPVMRSRSASPERTSARGSARTGRPVRTARPAGKYGIASSNATKIRFAKRPSRRFARPGSAFGSSSAVGMPSVSAAATAPTDA